ncbi:signal peptidase I [Crassaminicella indica]|uniref:Signal peptidase I n=1 Tax=Crassaminicella indica TaxID=2855394 RepID=A0ABX8RFB6_9CLOT|nr:signal peptidase I [Crassaminicella indica]QXM05631.1 signal peptidase I [Crassaminicella indica]
MLDVVFKWLKCILTVIVVTLLLERFVFGFTIVQGLSMQPTLKNNDKLFINKLVYLFEDPHRGDIIIFHPPIDEREDELFVKRVIAVEGDHFQIKRGNLYINNKLIEEPYIIHEDYQDRLYSLTSGIVPKGMVFVMGDNRNDSNDSRCFGFVPKKNIAGKADFRIWPLDTVHAFSSK